jgi:hypothetical protein
MRHAVGEKVEPGKAVAVTSDMQLSTSNFPPRLDRKCLRSLKPNDLRAAGHDSHIQYQIFAVMLRREITFDYIPLRETAFFA